MTDSPSGFQKAKPWVSLLVRIAMAGIMLWAGVAKLVDIPASVRAVRAYELLPEALVPLVGTALPFVEILLGIVLLMGLFTRWATIVYLLMVVAFMVGVIYAWAKGLQIDCGCFGGGGELEEGADPGYLGHLLERVGFLALGAWLLAFPRSRWSADALLQAPESQDD